MKEELIQYFWRTHKFKSDKLFTTQGNVLEIIDPGKLNRDSGPDFSMARIKIDGQLWVGNIEIHINASDWYQHKHQYDPAYQSIILHVVWEEDLKIHYPSNQAIPCLELKEIIQKSLLDNYERLMNNSAWIPCEFQLDIVDMEKLSIGLNAFLVEKLMKKTHEIEQIFIKTNKDWDKTFHIWFARAFGLNLNATAFEMLATNMDNMLAEKLKSQPEILEAVAFATAGLLDGETSEYAIQLQNTYNNYNKLEKPPMLKAGTFKYFRTRPANFPTIRIAQWLEWLKSQEKPLETILHIDSGKQLFEALKLPLEGFWATHFSFNAGTNDQKPSTGKDFAELLMINAISPFIFFYGKMTQQELYQDRAVDCLDQMNGERNAIISKFKALNFPAKTASQTQSLLWMKKHYCEQKRCLECCVGAQIFKT